MSLCPFLSLFSSPFISNAHTHTHTKIQMHSLRSYVVLALRQSHIFLCGLPKFYQYRSGMHSIKKQKNKKHEYLDEYWQLSHCPVSEPCGTCWTDYTIWVFSSLSRTAYASTAHSPSFTHSQSSLTHTRTHTHQMSQPSPHTDNNNTPFPWQNFPY